MNRQGQIALLTAPTSAPTARTGRNPWTAWLVEVGVALLIAGWLGFHLIPQLRARMELLDYRSTMHDLTGMVQAMPSRARAQHRVLQLHVDASQGAFHLAATQGTTTSYDTIERTLWLPKGLEVSEAPVLLTALPSGRLSATSIVVVAPVYHRLFRLTTTEQGLVHLHEEPTL
jgi:hypothetical protein